MANQGKNIRGEKEQDCLEYVRNRIFKREPYQGVTAYTATDLEYENHSFMYHTPGIDRHYFGLNQMDALQFEHLLRNVHPNPKSSEFPDFVSDRGFIEHFQVTSSEVRKKVGSIHQREESIFQKDIDKADQALYEQLGKVPVYDKVVKSSHVFKYPKHSYPYFCTSFKKTWEHHLSRIDSYRGCKDTGVFMIEYLDSALHMKEHFPVPDLPPETWFGDMLPRQESFHEYRLSRDKDMLYYYCFKLDEFCLQHLKLGNFASVDMSKFAKFLFPIPPLEVQREIVRILDQFTELTEELTSELTAELTARKKQYEHYRCKLLASHRNSQIFLISELCRISRGRVISKDYIRDNGGKYPVYSSQTENDGVLGLINSYEYDGEYLTWTTDGANAGTIFYRKGKFNITNVCGLLEVNQQLVLPRYLYYSLGNVSGNYVSKGMGNPKLMSNTMGRIKVCIPSLNEQHHIVSILDHFDALCSDLTSGLPAEIEARRKQYEYYRDKLLTFPERKN